MKIESITAYHGSGVSIDNFSYEWTGQGNDNLGSGWYFTTDREEAERYATATSSGREKIGGLTNPTLHVVELSLKNPFPVDKIQQITLKQAESIISKSPYLDDALLDFGEVEYEGKAKVMAKAAKPYALRNGELLDTLFALANDFFEGHTESFNRAVFNTLGYDGTYENFGEKVHYVAWLPEQIKIVDRLQVELCESSPPARPARLKRGL